MAGASAMYRRSRMTRWDSGLPRLFLQKWLILVLLLLYGGIIISFNAIIQAMNDNEIYKNNLTIIICVLPFLLIFMMRSSGFRYLSGPILYSAYLWLYHFALVFFTSIDEGLWDIFPWFKQWSFAKNWNSALLFSFLCMLAFSIGCITSVRKENVGIEGRKEPERKAEGGWYSEKIYKVGVGIVVIGIGLLAIGIWKAGGVSYFTKSYKEIATSPQQIFNLSNKATTVGMLFALVCARRKWLKFLIGAQAILSLISLLAGGRQIALIVPIMIPVILQIKGIKIQYWKILILIMGFLFIVSFISIARNKEGNTLSGTTSLAEVRPIAALIEMGGTLETVNLTFDWVDQGDDYLLGTGYLYSLKRTFQKLLFMQTNSDDPLALNQILLKRSPGLGGSSIAEAYYNFGVFGGLLFFMPLGFVLGRLELRIRKPRDFALYTIILYAVLYQARNYFAFIPPFLLFYYACMWITRIRIRLSVKEHGDHYLKMTSI